jgi:lysophospholipase L1-like esterase
MKKLIAFALFLPIGICQAQTPNIPFNDTKIRYEGRILNRSDAAELSWPGTSATINFRGTKVSAVFKDLDTANYYNVIVDNKVVSKFHTDTIKQSYVLASGLKKGKHTVQIFKRTEWDKGKTLFYGFELPKSAKLLAPPAAKKRKIEFFGNSITCGYAIEDASGKDQWYGYFQNNYLTYAAITARHFDAQYHCTAKSGIGIMLSWFPLIMPEMYNRTDPTDAKSTWDFARYTPDIVVINLFQNDSWLVNMPERAEFKNKFGTQAPNEDYIVAAYKSFVATIREKYPNASIICALGSMDATREGSPWPGYVQKALAQLNDPKMYTHFFPFKNSYGHPSVAEQQVMADSLIDFIEKNIKW